MVNSSQTYHNNQDNVRDHKRIISFYLCNKVSWLPLLFANKKKNRKLDNCLCEHKPDNDVQEQLLISMLIVLTLYLFNLFHLWFQTNSLSGLPSFFWFFVNA